MFAFCFCICCQSWMMSRNHINYTTENCWLVGFTFLVQFDSQCIKVIIGTSENIYSFRFRKCSDGFYQSWVTRLTINIVHYRIHLKHKIPMFISWFGCRQRCILVDSVVAVRWEVKLSVSLVQSVQLDIHCPIKDKISGFLDLDTASW